MSFTVLHTADLHLGKSFSSLPPERAGQRRDDLLATLTRMCRTARERRVDLCCIAGDLFDRVNVTPQVLAAVRRALAEADVPVLLAPGNHDPLAPGSPYLHGGWPGNVLLANLPGWQRVSFAGMEVWAFGYVTGTAHRSPWHGFAGCGKDALLVLHAACLAPGLATEAGYYSFSPQEIPRCAYCALGHHHRPAQVTPQAWYAGTPEPLEAETVPATALLVTLDGGARVEQLPVASRRHRRVRLDVSGRTAEEIWDRALAEAAVEDLLALELHGVLDLTASLDLAALQAELSARTFAATVETDALLSPTEMALDGVSGMLLAVTRERLERLAADDLQCGRLERAMRYAALALEGRL